MCADYTFVRGICWLYLQHLCVFVCLHPAASALFLLRTECSSWCGDSKQREQQLEYRIEISQHLWLQVKEYSTETFTMLSTFWLGAKRWYLISEEGDSKMNCLSSHFAYIVLLWYTSVILCLLSSVSLSAVFFMMSPEQKHPMFGSFSPLILFWQQQVSHLWSKLVANYVAYQSNGITRTRCTYEFVHYLQNSLRI